MEQTKQERLKAGQTVVMSDEELDALFSTDEDWVCHVATLPNPNQVGTLDRWIAFTKRSV